MTIRNGQITVGLARVHRRLELLAAYAPQYQSDRAILFAETAGDSAEAYVLDGAGNKVNFSPHAAKPLKGVHELSWFYDAVDQKTGKRVVVDMFEALRTLEAHTGTKLIHVYGPDGSELLLPRWRSVSVGLLRRVIRWIDSIWMRFAWRCKRLFMKN